MPFFIGPGQDWGAVQWNLMKIRTALRKRQSIRRSMLSGTACTRLSSFRN